MPQVFAHCGPEPSPLAQAGTRAVLMGMYTLTLCKEPWHLCTTVNPYKCCLQISFQCWESWRNTSGCECHNGNVPVATALQVQLPRVGHQFLPALSPKAVLVLPAPRSSLIPDSCALCLWCLTGIYRRFPGSHLTSTNL